MKKYLSILFILLSSRSISAQTDTINFEHAQYLFEEEYYSEAIKYIAQYEQECDKSENDSVRMQFNYIKGTALYYLDEYEQALPYLNKALIAIEKLPHEDCIFLEIIYGIGSCYNKLKQYENAEKYFRRVIIRGRTLGGICMITTQALSELAELYNKLDNKDLAKDCASQINEFIKNLPSKNWQNKIESLLDLANAYEILNQHEEESATYKELLETIEVNKGKDNEEYILYSSIYSQRLILTNQTNRAISVLEEMITIGNNLTLYNNNICVAYNNYLELLAKQNKVEKVETVLSDAIIYMLNTKDVEADYKKLYERIGNAFFEANNLSQGAFYLEKAWHDEVPDNIRTLGNFGLFYVKTNPQKSLNYFIKAESLINDSTDILTKKVIYSYIYTTYSNLEQFKDAIKYAEIAAPYIKAVDGNDYYASHLIRWALDCANINEIDKSQLIFQEVEKLLPVLSDKTIINYYSQYGFYKIKYGNHVEAIESLKKGINLCQESLGNNYAGLATMYHNLGRAYMLQQDYKNAIRYLNKSRDFQLQLNGKVLQRTLDYIKECEAK